MTDVKSPEHKTEAPKAPDPHLGSAGKTVPEARVAENDGPYDHLIGLVPDLNSGEVWILLSPTGEPISVQADPPAIGVPAMPGRINNSPNFHGLTTRSGAELSATMMPHPDLRFEGSPPEAMAASERKYEERRGMGPANVHRHTGESTLPPGNPQLDNIRDDNPTHSRNTGVVAGSTPHLGDAKHESKVEGAKAEHDKADASKVNTPKK
jgi:hypothetical protein